MCVEKETSWQAKEGAVMCKWLTLQKKKEINITHFCHFWHYTVCTEKQTICFGFCILNRYDCYSVPVSLEWNTTLWRRQVTVNRTSIHAQGQLWYSGALSHIQYICHMFMLCKCESCIFFEAQSLLHHQDHCLSWLCHGAYKTVVFASGIRMMCFTFVLKYFTFLLSVWPESTDSTARFHHILCALCALLTACASSAEYQGTCH